MNKFEIIVDGVTLTIDSVNKMVVINKLSQDMVLTY